MTDAAQQLQFDTGADLPMDGPELAALIAAKLCHDFISPSGAIMSGLDLLNDPTAQDMREDALGLITDSAKKMVALVQFCRVAFGAATVVFALSESLALSCLALAVVLGYSFTKRFTPLCHLVLGLGLGLAPVGAYLAATGAFAWAPVLLGLAVFAWVSGFDIIYALQDEEFDRAQGLQSIPAWLGGERALAVSRGLHTIAAVLLATAGYLQGAGWVFAGAWVVFALLLVRQHRLVSAKDLSRVNLAFFTTNGIGSVVFGLLALLDLGLRHWR
jgi:4-hydroxybenzoate polyprenyltransferase